jgi:hypothetical protein
MTACGLLEISLNLLKSKCLQIRDFWRANCCRPGNFLLEENSMRRTVFVLVMVGVSAIAAACDEKLSSVTGPTPNLSPTFTSIQRDIFNARDLAGRQACVECHSDQGRTPSGGMVLLEGRAYNSLVGTASSGKTGAVRVIPGDPANSYLVKKLDGASDIVGGRMPRGNGPFLTEGQMMVIRRWIELGAPNN